MDVNFEFADQPSKREVGRDTLYKERECMSALCGHFLVQTDPAAVEQAAAGQGAGFEGRVVGLAVAD